MRKSNAPVGHEVRIGDVDALLGARDADQIFAVNAAADAPLAGEHPDGAGSLAGREDAHRAATALARELAPRAVKEATKLVGGFAADLDHVVAPAAAAVADRQPRQRQVDAAGEGAGGVDDEDLAVVAELYPIEPEAPVER